jgi:chromate reductase
VAVAELRRVIKDADGMVIATPEYNGSIPGQLKNALDWASRPRGGGVLEGKPVATLSASPSRRGGAGAQADLRKVLGVIGTEIRGEEIAAPLIHEQFDEHGGLVEPRAPRPPAFDHGSPHRPGRRWSERARALSIRASRPRTRQALAA